MMYDKMDKVGNIGKMKMTFLLIVFVLTSLPHIYYLYMKFSEGIDEILIQGRVSQHCY